MFFFDCSVSYGINTHEKQMLPVNDINVLCDEMKRAGVEKAIVWRKDQYHGYSPHEGNLKLADDIRGFSNLFGLWSIIPSYTHEIPDPSGMVSEMKKNRIIGWRLFPGKHRFLPDKFVLGDWLALAEANKIPIFINTNHGTSLEQTAGLLESFPSLTIVLAFADIWPNDRFLRPFIAQYPNVYLDLTYYITAGGLEDLVDKYGAGRILFGSGFPDCYFGANMMVIRHAAVFHKDREAIAGWNMQRIIEEVIL